MCRAWMVVAFSSAGRLLIIPCVQCKSSLCLTAAALLPPQLYLCEALYPTLVSLCEKSVCDQFCCQPHCVPCLYSAPLEATHYGRICVSVRYEYAS